MKLDFSKIKDFFKIENKSYDKQVFSTPEEAIEYRRHWSQVATIFTMSRLIAGPIIIVLLSTLLFNGLISALSVGIIVGLLFLTDCIDGQIAKRHNAKTMKGKRLDQISDKIFTSVALIFAMIPNFQAALFVLLGELAIMTINTKNFKDNISSSQIGRIKMFPLALFAVLSFLGVSYPSLKESVVFLGDSLLDIVLKTTLVCQGATIISYIIPTKEDDPIEHDSELEELFANDPELMKIKRNKNGYIKLLDTMKFGLTHMETMADIEFNDSVPENISTLQLVKAIKKFEISKTEEKNK